jgi:hypothetical protein
VLPGQSCQLGHLDWSSPGRTGTGRGREGAFARYRYIISSFYHIISVYVDNIVTIRVDDGRQDELFSATGYTHFTAEYPVNTRCNEYKHVRIYGAEGVHWTFQWFPPME